MVERWRVGWRWLRRYVVFRTSRVVDGALGDNFPALPCASLTMLGRLFVRPSR